MQSFRNQILNAIQPSLREDVNSMDIDLLNRYLTVGLEYTRELGDLYTNNKDTIHQLFGMIIYIRKNNLNMNQIALASAVQPAVEEVAVRFYYKINKVHKDRIAAEAAKLNRQARTAHERGKIAAKKYLEKQKNRKNNKFCKNETEYYTTEDIEDIPTADLTFIKIKDSIFCLDNGSYINMMKHSADQKVRGDCKPQVLNRPLNCKFFYPILAAPRIFITEKSHNKRLKEVNNKKQQRKFKLKNKKHINFDTGLHIVGIKQGWDDVYDLEPANYPIGDFQSAQRISVEKHKKVRKYTVKQLKAECKRKGIKGYSKKKKAELILFCAVTDATSTNKNAKFTVVQLRKMCKKLKIKGYSKWKKAELLNKCAPKK